MSNSYYSDYLTSPHWKQKREERLRIDNWKCQFCGSISNLNVHHLTYERKGRENAENDLITLCEHCHSRLHDQMKRINERSDKVVSEINAEINMALEKIKRKFVTKQSRLLGEILCEYEVGQKEVNLILKVIRASGKYDWMDRYSTVNIMKDCSGFHLHSITMRECARFKRINAQKHERNKKQEDNQ